MHSANAPRNVECFADGAMLRLVVLAFGEVGEAA